MRSNEHRVGVVLSGGGSRAAYQAGVMRGISEILNEPKKSPFRIYTGISAGSLNAVFLASRADDFATATQKLWDLWANLTTQQVLKTDFFTFSFLSSRLAKDLTLGGAKRKVKATALLNNKPLKKLIQRECDFARLNALIERGENIDAIGIATTNYNTNTGVSFYNSHESLTEWTRPGRISVRAEIGPEHVLASSAIPIFFPPQKIGSSYYGDGSIRVGAPVSTAVHLGSERLMVVGVNYNPPLEEIRALNQKSMERITLVDVVGSMMNTVFLEGLEADLQRLNRINRTLRAMEFEHPEGLRVVPNLVLQPTSDVNQMADHVFKELPFVFRYLLGGLGVEIERGLELLTYVAFEKAYTQQLLRLGLNDAKSRAAEIRSFF